MCGFHLLSFKGLKRGYHRVTFQPPKTAASRSKCRLSVSCPTARKWTSLRRDAGALEHKNFCGFWLRVTIIDYNSIVSIVTIIVYYSNNSIVTIVDISGYYYSNCSVCSDTWFCKCAGPRSPSINFCLRIWVCLKMLCTPLYPMVLLIIIPMKNGYFIGKINPTFSGPNPYQETRSNAQ